MMSTPQSALLFSCILIILLFALPRGEAYASKDDFDYNKSSPAGPQHWGELHKEWAKCGDGRKQSPINLRDKEAHLKQKLGKLKTKYEESHAILRNHGHDVQLEWKEGGGWIKLNGTKYQLVKLHWHTPSEHSINGERYDLEMHMVHTNKHKKKTVVVAVLFQSGRFPDILLDELRGGLRYLEVTGRDSVEVGIRQPWPLESLTSYYRYNGSLTTPPCTQGILWFIMHEIMSVTQWQLDSLHNVIEKRYLYNARPLQHRNHRRVLKYRP